MVVRCSKKQQTNLLEMAKHRNTSIKKNRREIKKIAEAWKIIKNFRKEGRQTP